MTFAKRYIITGEPRAGKNSQQIRVNRKTGKRFIAKSNAASMWIVNAVVQLADQRLKMRQPTLRTPVRVTADVYQSREKPDLDNSLNALGDALQESLIIENDSLIVEWNARKFRVEEDARILVTVTPMEE